MDLDSQQAGKDLLQTSFLSVTDYMSVFDGLLCITALTESLVLLVFSVSQSVICLFLFSICILIVLALILTFNDVNHCCNTHCFQL